MSTAAGIAAHQGCSPSGPFGFQLGQFPHLYLPAALAQCLWSGQAGMLCINAWGVTGPSLTKPGAAGLHFLFSPPQVNVMAVSICTREAYQSMKERNIDDGHIININSMNGHSVVPQSVVHFYSATKYAVTAGITNPIRMCSAFFQCISPGLVETGFAFKLHDNDPERAAATYESIRCLKAEDMANAVIYVLSAPPHVQVGWGWGWGWGGAQGCPGLADLLLGQLGA
uniref:Dehydrogenase/reductase (SDR family) member 11 n=1 Tax=Zonotrichia albicollis TaxID=44394 RepID=A0A8D2N662_ZONAL